MPRIKGVGGDAASPMLAVTASAVVLASWRPTLLVPSLNKYSRRMSCLLTPHAVLILPHAGFFDPPPRYQIRDQILN